MSFNPDQFLAEIPQSASSFDPDAFLKAPAEPIAIKKRETDFSSYKNSLKENIKDETSQSDEPKKAKTFLESVEAGWQISVSGLASRGQAPDTVLPEDAPMAYRIANTVSTMAGDLPAMVAGAVGGMFIGGGAGSVVPVIGTTAGGVVGGAAGGNALPAALRETMMQAYEKGDVEDFDDFWERAGAVTIETLTEGVVGGVTFGVGGKVAKVLAPVAKPAIAQAGRMASEVITMTTLGKGLRGEMPEAKDFVDGAVLVTGLHGATMTASKLRKTFSKTGMHPKEVVDMSRTEPGVFEDLQSTNIEVPDKLSTEKPTYVETTTVGGEKLQLRVDQEALANVKSRIKTSAELQKSEGFDFRRQVIDDLDPLVQLTKEIEASKGEAIPFSQKPEVIAQLSRGHNAAIADGLKNATFDINTIETTGRGYFKILEDVRKKTSQKDFDAYLVSRRMKDLEPRNLKTGVDSDSAKVVYEQNKANLEALAKETTEFSQSGLKALKDSGVISEEAFNKMLNSGEHYAPLHRVVDESPTNLKPNGKEVDNPLRRMFGSDKEIVSPSETIAKNYAAMMQVALDNKVKRQIIDTAVESGFAEKVPSHVPKKIQVKADEIAKHFRDQFGSDKDAANILSEFSELAGNMDVWRQERRSPRADEVRIFRDGKVETYKMDKTVAETLNTMNLRNSSKLLQFLSMPAKTLRAGVTLSPDFFARNVFRDNINAAIIGEGYQVPFQHFFSGAASLFKNDAHATAWRRFGGDLGGEVQMDMTGLRDAVKLFQADKTIQQKAWNVVQSLLQMLQITTQFLESASRLGQFKREVGRGKTLTEAAYASRENSVDFAKKGASHKVQAARSLVAFLGAQIQGFDQTYRTFKDRPGQTLAKTAALVTLPSVATWAAFHDDVRYQEVPNWQKLLFWVVPTDDWVEAERGEDVGAYHKSLVRKEGGKTYLNKGTVYRIPKPFELGIIFGSVPEMMLERFFTDNPDAKEDFLEGVFDAFAPSLVPTAAVPMVEQYGNKSMFTGGRIIPFNREKMVPDLQFSDYTSETAKKIGSAIGYLPGVNDRGVSPAVVDNYIRAYTGGTGKYITSILDAGIEAISGVDEGEATTKAVADLPVIKSFTIRYPSYSSKAQDKFYDILGESQTLKNSVKQFIKDGERDEAEKIMADPRNATLLRMEKELTAINKDVLSAARKQIVAIEKDKRLSGDDKRKLIETLWLKNIQVTRRMVDKYHQNVNQLKELENE